MEQKKKWFQRIGLWIIIGMFCIVPFNLKVAAANFQSEAYTGSVNPLLGFKGQCTWYAWGRAYEVTGIALPCKNDAGTWLSVARENGFTTSEDVPRANSIAVWERHVAFVESVSGNIVNISEANWQDGTPDGTPKDITAEEMKYRSGQQLLGYIYLDYNGEPGTFDSVPPEIQSVYVEEWNVGSMGFIVCCDATDDVGLSRVGFNVWTENNGQDDMIWYEAVLEGNHAWRYIELSNHGNELGNYIIHAYAFDMEENGISMGTSVNIQRVDLSYYDNQQKIADGVYTLKNDAGLYMDVKYGESANGTQILESYFNNDYNQRFRFAYQGNGNYLIYPECANGNVLDVWRGGSLQDSIDQGDYIDIFTANDPEAQLFKVVPIGDGKYALELASKPNYVIGGRHNYSETQLYLQEYTNYSGSGRWTFCDQNGNAVDPTPITAQPPVSDPPPAEETIPETEETIPQTEASPGINPVPIPEYVPDIEPGPVAEYVPETKPALENEPNFDNEGYTIKNPFYNSGFDGQCTWYCWGRTYEVTGITLPCNHDAITWTDESGYTVGNIPRANSIAVWSVPNHDHGHVAFVESVSGDSVTISEANWNWRAGYSGQSTYTVAEMESRPGTSHLEGYIYLDSPVQASSISVDSNIWNTDDGFTGTAAPVIDNFYVEEWNVGAIGFVVACDSSDDIGIARAEFYVWTEANGQDDMKCYSANLDSGHAWVFVDLANHGNAYGNYIIHAYVYDGEENSDSAATSLDIERADLYSDNPQPISDGAYTLKNDTGYYMDVSGAGSTNGTPVINSSFNGSSAQRMRFEYQGDGKYLIYPECANGSVIDVYRGDSLQASIDQGDFIDIFTAKDPDAQLFRVISVGEGKYVLQLAALPSLVIGGKHNYPESDLYLQEYTNYSASCRWTFCDLNGNAVY